MWEYMTKAKSYSQNILYRTINNMKKKKSFCHLGRFSDVLILFSYCEVVLKEIYVQNKLQNINVFYNIYNFIAQEYD